MATDRQTTATIAVLSTLQRQFEAGATQSHRLSNLLVEAPNDQLNWLHGPFPVEGCRQPEQALAVSTPSTEIQFRVQKTERKENRVAKLAGPRVFQVHLYYVSGSYVTDDDKKNYIISRDHFFRLAERAGECLLSLPTDVVNLYPPEWVEYEPYLNTHRFMRLDSVGSANPEPPTVERTYDAILPPGLTWSDRWMSYLHWLAWRGEEGTILKATRKTWFGRTTLPWVATRTEYDLIASRMPPLIHASFEATRHFYSVLEDIFLCSALAIDVIVARLDRSPSEDRPVATGATNMSRDSSMPLKVMFCYSHVNRKQRDQLDTHLALMKRNNLIEIWYDRNITAGAEWEGHIDEHLNTSDIILLMVSADFIASTYCLDVEMKRAIERHKAGEARVIPVILRKCGWKNTLLKDLQALPTDALPVDQWARSNDAYHDIAEGIRAVVHELNNGP